MITIRLSGILNKGNKKFVSVHRAPHLLCYRALEVRQVRLRARRLASTAPCKRLQPISLRKIDNFDSLNE
jgi:hypothetical protein